jgi:hypothetical protein
MSFSQRNTRNTLKKKFKNEMEIVMAKLIYPDESYAIKDLNNLGPARGANRDSF